MFLLNPVKDIRQNKRIAVDSVCRRLLIVGIAVTHGGFEVPARESCCLERRAVPPTMEDGKYRQRDKETLGLPTPSVLAEVTRPQAAK